MSNGINAALVGYGKMGQILRRIIDDSEGINFVGAVGPEEGAIESLDVLYSDLYGSKGENIDVIIDFSYPGNLQEVSKFALSHNIPLVIATTGYTAEEVDAIKQLAEKIPVVYTANFSLGITILNKVLKDIAPVLKDSFDMEIIEKHHNRKVDAPSGTAKMLLASINEGDEFEEVFGRGGMKKREKEIGVHAIRGGTIAGEHTVLFAGEDEVLEFTHIANSRKIFAVGAVKAARFILGKPAGLYNMDQVLFN